MEVRYWISTKKTVKIEIDVTTDKTSPQEIMDEARNAELPEDMAGYEWYTISASVVAMNVRTKTYTVTIEMEAYC